LLKLLFEFFVVVVAIDFEHPQRERACFVFVYCIITLLFIVHCSIFWRMKEMLSPRSPRAKEVLDKEEEEVERGYEIDLAGISFLLFLFISVRIYWN
jgi:hypothetical protein